VIQAGGDELAHRDAPKRNLLCNRAGGRGGSTSGALCFVARWSTGWGDPDASCLDLPAAGPNGLLVRRGGSIADQGGNRVDAEPMGEQRRSCAALHRQEFRALGVALRLES
jgi:hypothetical protein